MSEDDPYAAIQNASWSSASSNPLADLRKALLTMQGYDFGEPYDPDMTVLEALRQGLIAVVDTGAIGGPDYIGCGFPHTNGRYRCTRMKGHKGVHAYVLRWLRWESVPEETAEDSRGSRRTSSTGTRTWGR